MHLDSEKVVVTSLVSRYTPCLIKEEKCVHCSFFREIGPKTRVFKATIKSGINKDRWGTVWWREI